MIYKDFQNRKLSALGLGCMRLPVVDGDNARIDEAAAQAMVDLAMAAGVNYYDTAWGYHEENSERFLGRALRNYPRDSFYLASKFPGYDLANMGKVEEIFPEQLRKCQVDHFDFYLFHNVCEMNIGPYLDPKNRILDYLLEQKQAGRIRHLGFSAHGSLEILEQFLDAYGTRMEFCQIQLNYLDWTLQDAKSKVELLNRRQLPIWVMEPLRGGRLSRLAEEEAKSLAALRPGETAAAWAFRFLQSVPGVTMILSGASTLEQLQENLRTFETDAPLQSPERDALLHTAEAMLRQTALPCTACRYCVSHCPQQLDIPRLLGLYNEHCFTGKDGFIAPRVVASLPEDRRPSACLGCGSCEAVCPQQIHIPAAMADFTQRLAL